MSRLPFRLLAGGVLTGFFLIVALVARVWTPERPSGLRIALRLRPPLSAGLLGTDALGRDILSMLMAGASTSLGIAVPAVLAGGMAGVVLGFLAAASEGLLRDAVLRCLDVLFAFPALLSGIVLGVLFGAGAKTAILAIAVFTLPVLARLAFSSALSILAQDYCLAAALAGKGRMAILRDHVLPNVAGLLAVQVSVQMGFAILIEAGLSYLGLSTPPPAASWGRMLNEAQTYLAAAPWMALAPGLTIAFAVLGFNLLGDGLRDWLDPRHRPEP